MVWLSKQSVIKSYLQSLFDKEYSTLRDKIVSSVVHNDRKDNSS